MCVDDGGDAVVVDVNRTTGHTFDADDTFIFRLMGQHRAHDAVADRVDAGENVAVKPNVIQLEMIMPT